MKIHIPDPKGSGKKLHIIEVEVNGWLDPIDGEIYLNGATTDFLDMVKMKEMALLKKT